MAKQTALQLVNKVLNNLGEADVALLTGLSGLSLLVFNTLNEVLYEIAFEYRYQSLETDGTITLSTGNSTVAMPTNMYIYDRDSFRYNDEKKIEYYTPQRFDREYSVQTNTGIPDKIIRWGNYWRPYPIPSSTANGKTIKYRYWRIPIMLFTSVPTGTCWVPEGFDVTTLADLVTYKIMHYKHNEEALTYYAKVWGDGRQNEGSLANFKSLYGTPEILESNLMVEPI